MIVSLFEWPSFFVISLGVRENAPHVLKKTPVVSLVSGITFLRRSTSAQKNSFGAVRSAVRVLP
jgi:hypothetical protein